MSDVPDMLRSAISLGPWPIGELKTILYDAGVTEWELRKGVSSLTREGGLAIITQKFWASPAFHNENRHASLYAEGHSRQQLIDRLSGRASSPTIHHASVEELMQGEDAERLAREAYGRNGD